MSAPCATSHAWLERLNAGTAEAFVAALGGAVEHAPWVAREAWRRHPFDSLDALASAMSDAIHAAPREAQLALLNGHPELAGREAQAGAMTRESTGEQGRLGLLALDRARLDRLTHLNAAYRARFGFPLIVALALHEHLDSVFADAERRLLAAPEVERRTALMQVCAVMRGRLLRMMDAHGAPDRRTPPAVPSHDSRKDLP